MKNKIYVILSVLLTLMALSACATADDGSTEVTGEATTPEATTPEVTTPEVTTPEVTTPEVTPVAETDYMAMAEEFLAALPDNSNYAISADELIAAIDAAEDIVILDVRPADLFDAGHVDGAAGIPLPTLLAQMETLPADKKIAVVCMSDANSAFAVSILRIFGDFDAWVVTGGVQALVDAGEVLVPTAPATEEVTTEEDVTEDDTTGEDTTEEDTTEEDTK